MQTLDKIAARLQSFKIVISLFLGSVLSMLLFAFSASPSISLSPLLPMFGMMTCWGLLGIAYLFAPGKGPLSPQILARKQGFFALHDRCMRFIAPGFFLLWFLAPAMVLLIRLIQR
jgi:hypothetical protein